MTPWLAGVLLLVPALVVPTTVALRGDANNRLVAVQLASALSALLLALMSFAFDQSSSVDLALSAALLSIPGTYLYALFMERWL